MGQNRSADPWSTFLGPERAGRASGDHWAAARHAATGAGAAPGALPGGVSGPAADLSRKCRLVLDALTEEDGPLPVEGLHDRVGMSLLEVADTVRALSLAGLVEVIREGTAELVRLAGPADAGPAGPAGPAGRSEQPGHPG